MIPGNCLPPAWYSLERIARVAEWLMRYGWRGWMYVLVSVCIIALVVLFFSQLRQAVEHDTDDSQPTDADPQVPEGETSSALDIPAG